MVLLLMFVAMIGIGLAGSRAVLWTLLFFMAPQIVRNMNMANAVDHDARDLRLATRTS